jgi:hypothetical protein
MRLFTKKTIVMFLIPFLLVACATGGGSRGSSAKAAKVSKSKVCRGKIGPQSGLDNLLDIALGDPAGFACNATVQFAESLRLSYEAVGHEEEARLAASFIETLRNGTGDPNSIKTIAPQDSSTEKKEEEQRMLADVNNAARLEKLRQAQVMRNKAIANTQAGVGAFLLGVYQAIETFDKTDDPILKAVAIAKGIELAKLYQLPPAIYEANKAYNANMAHLDKLINVPKADGAELMNVKPPSAKK